MRYLVLTVGLFAIGCDAGGTFAPKPGQVAAVQLVWNDIYGQAGEAPPIEWVDRHYLWDDVVGFTVVGSRVIIAADDAEICGTDGCGGEYRFSSTALAHELMHYRTWVRTGDVDPLHFRGDWQLAGDADQKLFAHEQAYEASR